MQRNDNTPHKPMPKALSRKEMKKITIEQMLCTYTPEFTLDPDKAAKAADEDTASLVPIISTVLVGIN